MPISRDEFEERSAEATLSTGERIVRFLTTHDEQAFTRAEIAEALAVDANTVGTNLSRLKGRELVRHRGRHWAITDDRRRLAAAFKTRYEMEWFDEVYGPEDQEQWFEHAADPAEFDEDG